MFRDKSLMPKEAIRLAALGLLGHGPMRYGDLANEVRHFTTRYWGPTLDVMASSIELMRLEGLVEVTDQGETPGDAMLRLTQAGRDELLALLGAAVRVPSNDFNKLIVALKLKFLDALDPAERAEQVDALVELREAELARLTDLRTTHVGDDGPFARWLDHDITLIEADLTWFRQLREELSVV
jgi:DNA-binding PadR family transcriptional regulator